MKPQIEFINNPLKHLKLQALIERATRSVNFGLETEAPTWSQEGGLR